MKNLIPFNSSWLRNIVFTVLGISTFVLSVFGSATSNVQAAAGAQSINQPGAASNVPELNDPQELESFLDSLIPAKLDEKHIAGAAVVIVKDGRVFFSKGYGYADVEAQIPVDPETTLFRMGSIGKLFTWTAVMQQVEQGRLDLDTDVNEYLDFTIPDTFPEPITLKHLMTHTAGFEEMSFGSAAKTPEDLITTGVWLADNIPARAWAPGEVPSYSNYGASLAGYIVERVTGMSYEDYVEQNILMPLEMTHSTARQPVPQNLEADLSRGYLYFNDAFQPQGFEYMNTAPAGSISATATDMANFMIAHLQYGRFCAADCASGEVRILGEDTAKQMQSRLWAADERINGMAYGFMESSQNGQRVIGHNGDTILFHSTLALLPEQNVGLLFSYNSSTYGVGTALLEAFMDRYYPAPATHQPASLADAAAHVDRFTGHYQFSRVAFSKGGKIRGLLFEIKVKAGENGELMVSMPGSTEPRRLVETAPLYFQEIEGDGYVMFREDESGDIAYLYSNIDPFTPAFAGRKVAGYEGSTFNFMLLAACAAIFLLAIVVELVRLIVGLFKRRTAQPQPALARTARAALVLMGLLSLGMMFGLFMQSTDSWAIATGERGLLTALGSMSIAITVLSIGTVILNGLAYRQGWWSTTARVYHSIVALAGIAFLGFLAFWNQIGWQWW